MSDARLAVELPDGEEEEQPQRQPLDRSRDLLGRRNSPLRKRLDKLFGDIVKGFEDQARRSDDLDAWWNCYNCVLDENQFYNGNAEIYVPIIRDAINARATRFANQLFPASGRYIDCTTSDGGQPYEILALLNHYIQSAQLKTQIVKPLLRCGDIEGQYNLYIDWKETQRQLVQRRQHGILIPHGGGFVEADGEQIEDIDIEDIEEGCPAFEVLHDSDVLILPQSADGVEDALARGGAVVIVRRWSKDKVEEMAEADEIRSDEVEDLKEANVLDPQMPGLNDVTKELIRSVGIRTKGPHTIVFETWTMLPLNDSGQYAESGVRRLCRAWFGIRRTQLGCKRNPFWNDRCPLLSVPVEKIPGVAKGKSQVEALAPIQYEANDAANERADVDHYASMPIIMRRPGEGNGPLILNLAAVWDVDPAAVKFAEFPDLSQRATDRIMAATTLIFQSLGVNPAMLPQQSGRRGGKRNQAEIAMEQQVDLLTTAEAVSVVQEGMLDPLIGWCVDLDHQFRDTALTVRAYGELGIEAAMIDVPPLQNRTRYHFTWCGAEQARLNLAMQQAGTALINVARGVAQQLTAEGYELRLGPAMERAFENVLGPKTARLMLVDKRRQMTVDAKLENELMAEGHSVPVHPLDNDAEHLKLHYPEQQQTGDPHGVIRLHIQAHIVQMSAKNQAMVKSQMPGMMGAPGVPGGAGPGVAGTPRPGAVPSPPRQMQQPAGAIHPDQMVRRGGGVVPMPRRF